MLVVQMLAVVVLLSTHEAVDVYTAKDTFKTMEACLEATMTEKYTSAVDELEKVLPDEFGGPVKVILQCKVSSDEKAAAE